jgi:periplasmic protein TonB
MASATFDEDGGWKRWGRYAIPALALLAAAWLIWTFAHQVNGVRREAPSISTLIPVEEPPPPPPPAVKPPPEPVEQTIPQPTPQQPQPTPRTPSPAQPTVGQNAVTENGPAQSGSDAFNIGAGNGSGGRGSGAAGGGFAESAAMYGQYAKGEINRAVRSSPLLKGKSLHALILVWFDGSGRITRVERAQSAGVAAYDTEIRRVVAALALRAPGQGVLAEMPIHFAIDERPSL